MANLYRDKKGRMRNADSVTPENQERIYKGLNPIVEEIEIKETRKKVTTEKGIYFKKEIKYFDLGGNEVDEIKYKRFKYAEDLKPQTKERSIFNYTQVRWDVIPTIRNAVFNNEDITYDGKKIDATNIIDVIRQIREQIQSAEKNDEGTYDIIFDVTENPDYSTNIISLVNTESDEE